MFKKEYNLVKEYRTLRESRIKNKDLKYTIKDVGHATLEIQVRKFLLNLLKDRFLQL